MEMKFFQIYQVLRFYKIINYQADLYIYRYISRIFYVTRVISTLSTELNFYFIPGCRMRLSAQ